MKGQQALQGVSPFSQDGESLHHGVNGQHQIVSPYITATDAVTYLALGSKSALYHHIRENRLPTCRIGRHLRFDIRELDAWVRNGGDESVPTITARKRLGLVKA